MQEGNPTTEERPLTPPLQPHVLKERLENAYAKPFASLGIAQIVIDKLLNRMFNKLSSQTIAAKLPAYSVQSCFLMVDNLVRVQLLAHDRGERSALINETTSAFVTDAWTPSIDTVLFPLSL